MFGNYDKDRGGKMESLKLRQQVGGGESKMVLRVSNLLHRLLLENELVSDFKSLSDRQYDFVCCVQSGDTEDVAIVLARSAVVRDVGKSVQLFPILRRERYVGDVVLGDFVL